MAVSLVTHTLTETSYNVAGNYSTVRYLVQLKTSGASYNSNNITTTYTINGVNYSNTHKLPKASTTTIVDQTVTVYHNADGTGSTSASFRCPTGISAGTMTGNLSLTLTTIPRASQPSVSSGSCNLDSGVTIYTNRASGSFTHTIVTTVNGVNVETFYNVGASHWWVPTIANYANKITGSNSATCTITCYTYNNGVHIGTKTCTISLVVPSSVKPSASVTIAENNPTIIALGWGVLVQGKSTLRVNVTGTGIHGSWIKSYNTSANGTNYGTSSFVTNPLTNSGTVSATVTDSRNYTSNSATKSYTVVEYSNPQISQTEVVRCLSDGTEKDDGTCIKYTFKGSITPVGNKNSKLFQIGYKLKTDSTYTMRTLVDDAYTIDHENVIISDVVFDATNSYDIIFVATDSLGTSQITRVINTGRDLMNFNASGKSMALGKISEAGANEEKLEIEFKDGVFVNRCVITDVYSTSEKRIGTWFGKPLYQKTFTTNDYISGSGGTITIPHDISNVEFIYIERGIFFNETSTGLSCQLPIGNGYNGGWSDANRTYAEVDKTNIYIRGAGGWGNTWKKIIIINYTKTDE